MAKIYDFEKEKQKAKERANEFPCPSRRFHNPETGIVVYPTMERGPDGKWRISDPEAVKFLLAMDLRSLL